MVTLYNKLLFLPRKSKREFIHKNRTMKTSVKFILMFVLLMLSFSISGNALNIMECSHNPVTSCQVSSSSLDANYSYRCGSDFAGFDKSQTLSVSDVELGLKPVSETYSSTNNLRLRRILEDSDLFNDTMRKLCLLRENLLVLDQSKSYYSDKDPHYASISCQYYIFALRRILI